MGTRRAFVFTNSIFVVQTLLALLLIGNVSPAPPPPPYPPFPHPPSLSTWLQQQQQYQPVGRTFFAPTSPPPGGSRTSEAVFTSTTQATTDRQNNFSPNVSFLPVSSSVILRKRRRHLADKTKKGKVKQTKKGANYKRKTLIVSLRTPSKSDSLTPMTVTLKGSAETTVTPSFGTITSPRTETASSESPPSSFDPSSPLSTLEHLNAHGFRSVLPATKTPTLTSLFDAASSSSSSEQDHKQPSFSTDAVYSLSTKSRGNKGRQLGRKTDYKRLSAKGKPSQNVSVADSVTVDLATYYVQLLLNHLAKSNRIDERTQLYPQKLRETKGKNRTKLSEMRPAQTPDARTLPIPDTDSVNSGDKMRKKTLPDRETNDQPLFLHRDPLPSKTIAHNVKEKEKFLTGSFSLKNKIEMQESRDENIEVKVPPHVEVRNISQTERFYSLSKTKFASSTKVLPHLHIRRPGNTSHDINEKENNSRTFENKTDRTSIQKEKREPKRTDKTLRSIFSEQTNILKRNQPLVVEPVINPPKNNEPLHNEPLNNQPLNTPAFSSAPPLSAVTSFWSMLIEKTATVRPEIDVDGANPQLEPEIRHSNPQAFFIPSTTTVRDVEIAPTDEPEKTVYDAETEVNNIISGNSKIKNEFMLYKEHQNRQRRVARRRASDTFATARVHSSTLPTRSTTNHMVTTVRPPLSAANRSLNKTTRNSTRLDNRDGISTKNGPYSGASERRLQKSTNAQNAQSERPPESKQFQNQSGQYQLNRDEDPNLSRSSMERQRRSTKRLRDQGGNKMPSARKKRGFFWSDDIGLDERKEAKEVAKKPLVNGVLNDGSVDDVFAGRSRVEPREARNNDDDDNDEDLYETIYLSPSESKVAFSTLEFPETALRSPVFTENSETAKPLQILDIAVDTAESSNEYGSGDELGHSFLIPCSRKERYFCLNGGTCLIVYTIDVKTCRCAVGFIGQRCEQIDHNYFYTLLRDTDYLN